MQWEGKAPGVAELGVENSEFEAPNWEEASLNKD